MDETDGSGGDCFKNRLDVVLSVHVKDAGLCDQTQRQESREVTDYQTSERG